MIESKGHKITPIDGDLAVSINAEIGGDADIHGKARVAGSLKVEGFLDAPNIKGAVKGLFATEEELKREYPNPRPGWCAIVLADNKSGFLYLAKNREWEKQSEEAKPFDFIVDSINVFASKGELAEETRRAQSAEHLLTQRIVNETVRATEAENEIKKDAVKFSRIGITRYAEKLELLAGTIGDEVRYVDIPAATTSIAGVMSAEDKLKMEDALKKTNNIRVVEASSETEEIVICNNDQTEEIVKINNEGLAAKKIFNLDGEELKPSGLHSIADDPAILEICDEKQCPILTIDSKGNVNTASFNSLNVAKNKFKGKTMLYIGDSISTGNIWHWKGYIKDGIGLDYVDYNISDTVNVTPAVGGITIRPHNDDDTRPMNAGAAEVGSGAKSIWWRCCNKRLGIYDFDYINLFGGTNDIYDNNLNVGTIDDAPLLDTDVEDLTALDLSKVSFASAFMGCIEMLQRDFPSKPIFICTLLYNSYAKTPEVVKIQMLAAQKYGLKVVPFYYSELNSQNYQWLCDGFHPNQIAARIMEKNFVQYINL